MENKSPSYRILAFTTSNKGGKHQWFSLEIQLHASHFRISVSPSNFRDSPARSDEFQKYLSLLCSEKDGHDDSFDETDEEDGSGEAPNRTTLYDCFDWAVNPCLPHFVRLSPALPPPESGQLTLSHFLASTSFECDLNATDDVLSPEEIEPIEIDGDYPPSPSSGAHNDSSPSPNTSPSPFTTPFPSFHPTEIAVLCDDPNNPLDSNPSRVRIGQHHLYFKKSLDPDDSVTKREIATYEKIASANFGAEVRTSRLYGVVRNEREQIIGLLLYLIEEDTLLTFALGLETPDALKNRWARQVRETVAALHGAGIVWGDVKPGNVLVDVHGDAWVVDFGGGRTEGWVDSGVAGTVEGDLQGLERVLRFIFSGGEEEGGCSGDEGCRGLKEGKQGVKGSGGFKLRADVQEKAILGRDRERC